MGARHLGNRKLGICIHQLICLDDVGQDSLSAVSVQYFADAKRKRTCIEHPDVCIPGNDGYSECGNDDASGDVGADHQSAPVHAVGYRAGHE